MKQSALCILILTICVVRYITAAPGMLNGEDEGVLMSTTTVRTDALAHYKGDVKPRKLKQLVIAEQPRARHETCMNYAVALYDDSVLAKFDEDKQERIRCVRECCQFLFNCVLAFLEASEESHN